MMLEARNIGKRFSTASSRPALDGVNVTVGEGEFVCVLGRSGSGKSTLLHVLSTLLQPDFGTITYQGREIVGLNDRALVALRRHDFSMVFQMHHLLPYLTAMENVLLPKLGTLAAVSVIDSRKAEACLESVGLKGMGERLPGELSGGEQQRVAIARALITEPRVLFADEPTGSLDQATGEGIIGLLKDYNSRGGTVVMVTHEASYATVAHRMIRLEDGRKIYDGPGSIS